MGKKHEKPLYLDIPFEEALGKFIQTDPTDVNREKRQRKLKAPSMRNNPPDNGDAPSHKGDVKV